MSLFPAQYTAFIILAPLTALLTAGVLVYAWQDRSSPDTGSLMMLMSATTSWLVFNTLELLSSTATTTFFWAKVSYPFIATTPVAWFIFALRYTGKKWWVPPTRLMLLGIIPLITSLLVFTNSRHHLIWHSYHFENVNNMLAMHVSHGTWFWVHVVYSYILVFLGTFFIGKQSLLSFNLYRRQSIWLLIGALIPVLTNMIYIFDVIPNLQKDYTAISFAIAALAFTVGIFRYRLFDLRPVAREAVIDSMQDAMFAVDSQHRIIDFNPAAQRYVDLGSDDILGKSTAEILKPWPDLLARFHSVDNVQTDISIDQKYYDLRISPLTDHQGRKTGKLIMLRDITERKQAEETLRLYTAELESRNAQLDAFAHTVAHDLKNPLTTVVGYSSLLSQFFETMSQQDIQDNLRTIQQKGNKLVSIVDALLMLSSVHRLDDTTIDRLDMHRIVNEAQERLSELLTEHQVNLTLPETWPVVRGFAPWIEEVWMNYITNAIKYGGNPPHIELGFDDVQPEQENKGENPAEPITPTTPRHTHVRFWVRDNGPGLTEAQQAQLFTQFTRLHKDRAEGHGLGLSIVRRIVEKLGGEVGVESEVGQGSLFWFTLPCDT